MPPLPDQGAAMDAMYRVQRHVYDLTRRNYLLGRDRLISRLGVPPGGTVLEMGCGTARNLIRVARLYPDSRLHGLDVSAVMLETARANVQRAGLAHRINLARGDATGFDAQSLFGIDRFDRVYASYTLSMIPDWRAAIEQGCAALAPGGRLSIVDFGQQEQLPRWFRAALRGWLARFAVTPRSELIEHCLHIAAMRDWLGDVERPFRGYAWLVALTRPVRPGRQESRSPLMN